MAIAGERNWTHAENRVPNPFDRGALECHLDHNTAFRINGKWYLATGITNAPSAVWLRDYERAYMDEYIRKADDGQLESARMTVPIEAGDGEEATDQATTVIARWAGAAQP